MIMLGDQTQKMDGYSVGSTIDQLYADHLSVWDELTSRPKPIVSDPRKVAVVRRLRKRLDEKKVNRPR